MDGGLLHLGAMAVLIGLAYLNLDKINTLEDEQKLHELLEEYCDLIRKQVVQRDEAWDSAKVIISGKFRDVFSAACMVCAYDCEVSCSRPKIGPRLSAMASALQTLRRAHLTRYVAGKIQPEYPLWVWLWFWIDRMRCAPALHLIRSKQHEIVIGTLTSFSIFALFDEVALEIFDGKFLGVLPVELPAAPLYFLYGATIASVIMLTLAARRLEGRERWDFIPRCNRYLKLLHLVYELQDAEDQLASDEGVGDFISNW
jgi:hypothetical protein